MFICKHCKKGFIDLSTANKANHSRWCQDNPKRRGYTENLIAARLAITEDSRKKRAAKIVKLHEQGRYKESYLKSIATKIKNGTNTHTEKTKQLLREKALASPHRRLKKRMIEYNGVWLDSTWELELAKRLDYLKIKWVRPTPVRWKDEQGTYHNYFPDFYLPDYNLYLDPKNPHARRVQRNKLKRLLEQLKNLIIIETLEECRNFNLHSSTPDHK